jgi:hypothetical protein
MGSECQSKFGDQIVQPYVYIFLSCVFCVIFQNLCLVIFNAICKPHTKSFNGSDAITQKDDIETANDTVASAQNEARKESRVAVVNVDDQSDDIDDYTSIISQSSFIYWAFQTAVCFTAVLSLGIIGNKSGSKWIEYESFMASMQYSPVLYTLFNFMALMLTPVLMERCKDFLTGGIKTDSVVYAPFIRSNKLLPASVTHSSVAEYNWDKWTGVRQRAKVLSTKYHEATVQFEEGGETFTAVPIMQLRFSPDTEGAINNLKSECTGARRLVLPMAVFYGTALLPAICTHIIPGIFIFVWLSIAYTLGVVATIGFVLTCVKLLVRESPGDFSMRLKVAAITTQFVLLFCFVYLFQSYFNFAAFFYSTTHSYSYLGVIRTEHLLRTQVDCYFSQPLSSPQAFFSAFSWL